MSVRSIFVAVIVIWACELANATPQELNILIFEGKQYPVRFDPMQEYFDRFPERKIKAGARLSSLWRGYVAVLEIANSQLFLKDIVSFARPGKYNPDSSNSLLTHVVPDGNRLKITWFTGLILSGYGENSKTDFYDLHYDDGYESFSIFEIEKGEFTQTRNFNNKEFLAFRKKQIEAFKKTDEYKEALTKLISAGRSKEISESIIEDSIFYHSTRFLVR